MTVIGVTTETFREQVLNSDLPVVVDFYAEWCRPCHQMTPIVENLSREHDGLVRFAKVDIDEEPEIARAYRVSSIPAVLLFESGAPTAWSLGVKPGYVLEKELRLSRRAIKTSDGAGSGHEEAARSPGLVAALRSWWGSQ